MIPESELVSAGQQFLYPNYRQPPFVFVRGQGSVLFDAAGKRYLDLYAGIAVSTLGHAHPKLTAAIAEQAGKLLHVSNYFYNEPNVRLAKQLCRLTGMDRAFFCNSGTEAIEATLKLARRYFYAKGERDRYRIIAFKNSFHGRTLGALAATGQDKYKDGFGPLPGVTHVAYGEIEAVRRAMGPDVAGILVEPVQGEGGVLPAPPGFLRELRALTSASGSLLLADEVQTGVGRSGKFLAFEHEGIQADVVALAKALGGGVPIGAMVCKRFLEEALPPGSHGSTFGGNPLASASALAVLDVLENDGLLAQVNQRGEELSALLARAAAKFPKLVETTRGRGLLQALVLREGVDARKVLSALQESGVLVTIAGGQALRFSPPLVVTQAELEEGVSLLERALSSYG
ncbi:MAG TPA: aspartate aminotransferase family protein [Polyangiaceae bacterium]|jgi:acetylornithine/N-succinyldiaminopimelate aminotransferase|nr:aspartate aminotransferase family protein [Polyangiaceae bacterium]